MAREDWSSVNVPIDLAYKLRIYAHMTNTTAPAIVERLITNELRRAVAKGIPITLGEIRKGNK